MPVRNKRPSRAEWADGVEALSLRDAEELRSGYKAFRTLSRAEQLRLAGEVAATRARELCIAYESVIAVTSGYKTTCGKSKRSRLTSCPCVVFIVRRKWKSGSRKGAVQHIPPFLPVFADIAGKRALCAVPTDVVAADAFATAWAHAMPGVDVDSWIGNITCAAVLRVRDARTNVLMSCMHVFTPDMAAGDDMPVAGATIALNDGSARPVATALEYGGNIALAQDGSMSFDVQLAQSHGADMLRAALDGMHLSRQAPFVVDKPSFDAVSDRGFELLNSPYNTDGEKHAPLKLRFETYVPREIPIAYKLTVDGEERVVSVHHRALMRFRVVEGRWCAPGDSGSPVVLRRADGSCTLVGMHIGGPDPHTVPQSYGYAIPAWLLFDPVHYSVLPKGAQLEPVM